jgi:hypothetical protein
LAAINLPEVETCAIANIYNFRLLIFSHLVIHMLISQLFGLLLVKVSSKPIILAIWGIWSVGMA